MVARTAIALGHGRTRTRPVGKGRVQVMQLKRAGTVSYVWVYRPAVKDSSKLPVMYFLHGLPGKPGDVFRDTGLQQLMDAIERGV